MTNKQIGIYSMGRRTVDNNNKHLSDINTVPAIVVLNTNANDILLYIDNLRVKKETDSSGVKTQKETKRALTTKICIDISRRLVGCATMIGDDVILSEARYTETDLNNSSDNDFVTACTVICNAGQKYYELAKDYGLTLELVTRAFDAVATYKQVMNLPKENATEQKQITMQISSATDDLLEVLSKMDVLVEILKDSHHDYYVSYQECRKLSYRSGSLTVKCFVKDSVSGTGLSGTLVTFTLNGVAVLVKTTAEAGGFTVKSLDEGHYTLTITKLGYVTQTMEVNILGSELTNLEIKLAKA